MKLKIDVKKCGECPHLETGKVYCNKLHKFIDSIEEIHEKCPFLPDRMYEDAVNEWNELNRIKVDRRSIMLSNFVMGDVRMKDEKIEQLEQINVTLGAIRDVLIMAPTNDSDMLVRVNRELKDQLERIKEEAMRLRSES